MANTEPMLPLLKNTLFINLPERQDRRSHIQHELSKLGIQEPTRFNAIKTQMGQVGCSMSHLKCLEMAKKAEWDHVFICEDDAVFTNPPLLLNRIEQAQNIAVWDVLIVGGNNQRPFFPTSYEGFIQVHNCQTTTAYIVKKKYYDVLIQNIKESLEKLLREPKLKHLFSVDIYWKKCQIKDTWLMPIPATVSQLDGVSDIEGRPVSYNQMMLDYEKKWMENSPILAQPQMLMPFSTGHLPANFAPVQTPVVIPSSEAKTNVSMNMPGLSGSGWGKGFLKQKKAKTAIDMKKIMN